MTAPATTATTAPAVPDAPAASTGAEDADRCGACEHPLAAHDPIGLRFCRATRVGDITRGCVCRVG